MYARSKQGYATQSHDSWIALSNVSLLAWSRHAGVELTVSRRPRDLQTELLRQ